ncbi:hypothetical protein HYC85_023522 [Camellia sinensis]|uniref:Uncharacterized protein n=1 Tax=Camellia sinensis TaxID=4442 RepID=A0A7J7GET8_CAMSI|nr:hypothetical protein HYC85_023522 [Camellia sinensis]
MHSLTSFSSTKPHIIIASLSNNNPPPPHTNPKPPLHRINTPNPSTTAAKHLQLKQKQQKQKQKQPSVAEIEKVIGAGIRNRARLCLIQSFRIQWESLRGLWKGSSGRLESGSLIGLRDLLTQLSLTDRLARYCCVFVGFPIPQQIALRILKDIRKNILLAVFQFVLPIWILSFLVASGIVKLPFSTPFLDDLIM